MICNQFGTKVHILRLNNGMKYFNNELIFYCQKKRIIQPPSNTNTLQQNMVTERKNRYLL